MLLSLPKKAIHEMLIFRGCGKDNTCWSVWPGIQGIQKGFRLVSQPTDALGVRRPGWLLWTVRFPSGK